MRSKGGTNRAVELTSMTPWNRSKMLCVAALAAMLLAFAPPAAAQDGDASNGTTTEGCAVTPGGWGAQPAGENPAAVMYANWDDVVGEDGLTVDGYHFPEPVNVTNAIPSGDALLNHAVALKLNLLYGEAGLLDGSLEGVTVPSGPYAGMTASELLAEAEAALADADRTTSEYSDLIEALTGFNEEQFGCAEADEEPCPEGEMRNDAGECVAEPCPEGEMRNDAGECVAEPCPEGEMRNDAGECVTPPPPPAPDCPADLAVTTHEDASITLDWTASEGAATYNVYRGTSADDLMVIGSTAETSFTDNATEPGTTYVYMVTAVGPGGESEGCETVEATAIPFFPNLAVGALALVGAVGLFAALRRRHG